MKIIGVCGFQGAGKDTIADYLQNFHQFRRESFAGTLKDAVASIFGWDRILLEGRTKDKSYRLTLHLSEMELKKPLVSKKKVTDGE